jgi:serine/threonine-protein kinase
VSAPRRNVADLVGEVLDGRYRLDAVIGEGGMGAVFRAQHLAMDRRVAIKLLKPHLATDPVALKRFVREARGTLKVDSPHAVKVLDFGATDDGFYYIVLEFLDGRTVQRELDVDGPFAPRRVVHVARHAAEALAAAHRIGLVHRDIKPDNVLLTRVGDDADYGKVLDFGVAKLMEGVASPAMSALALTQAGMVFGTPEFMSPEQACGLALDGRSDLYSLAATMFVMLTNRPLFPADSTIAFLTAHARTPAPRLAEAAPELGDTAGLDQLLARCLAKHKESRPASAEALVDELAAIEARLATRPVPIMTAATVQLQVPRGAPGEVAETGFVAALPSAFGSTLAATTVPSGGTTGLAAAARPGATTHPTTGAVPVRPRRTGLLIGLAAAVVATLIAAVVVIARHPRRGGGGDVPLGAGRLDAGAARANAPTADATIALATALVAAPPVDAGLVVDAGLAVPDAGARVDPIGHGLAPDPRRAEAALHLRNARAARGQPGGNLKQLSEADLARTADPHSAEANFLFGDALITGGNLERGCEFLRRASRLAEASARARDAGCPTR